MNAGLTRCLPTYEDATVSYSLRLPTYRSSYIRRYHPYARYTTPIVQEQFMDEDGFDEPFLDLSILELRVEPVRLESTTTEDAEEVNQCHSLQEEQPQELYEPFVPVADAEAANMGVGAQGEPQELNEEPNQNIAFIRVDIAANS